MASKSTPFPSSFAKYQSPHGRVLANAANQHLDPSSEDKIRHAQHKGHIYKDILEKLEKAKP